MEAAIAWAREHGLHKLSLSVLPNEAALALWRTFAFDVEGPRRNQIRRADGELRDVVDMGLLLTPM